MKFCAVKKNYKHLEKLVQNLHLLQTPQIIFSDDREFTEEEGEFSSADDEFIDDAPCEEEQDESFYRNLNNREEYVKFPNQTRNPIEVLEEPEEDYFGEDERMNCFIQKTRKMLILICLILTLTSLQNLRITFCTLQMLTITFFMQLFTVLCITN